MKNSSLSAFGIIAASMFFAHSAEAKPFNLACPDLENCLKAVTALTGDQYVYNEKEIKGVQSVVTSQDLELTAENANLLLSTLLHSNSMTRVPSGNKMYVIMRDNDAKGMALPVFHATATETPEIPDNWDMVTLKYKATYPESVKHMENIIRTYANMGARIYGVEQSGYLILTDNARNVKNMISFMRENDVKISPALLKRWAIEDELRRKEAIARAANEAKNNEPPKPHNPPRPGATPKSP